MKEPLNESGAVLSPCRSWRYALWRIWDQQHCSSKVMFIGLNPSTADELRNDLTISKCIGFAKRWGFGGVVMLNLFSFRATDPQIMINSADPVGPENDKAFATYNSHVDLVIAAWGLFIRDIGNNLAGMSV
jgi:hypothetical protein